MPDTPDDKKARQVERSQRNRDAAKAERAPDLEQLAKAALYVMLDSSFKDRGGGNTVERKNLDRLQDAIVAELVYRGFSERASERAFDDQVNKHRQGTAPRRKVHLPEPPEDIDLE